MVTIDNKDNNACPTLFHIRLSVIVWEHPIISVDHRFPRNWSTGGEVEFRPDGVERGEKPWGLGSGM